MLPFRVAKPRKLGLPLFILDGHQPVPCESEQDWQTWMKSPARRVADTRIDDVEVSTVFLGVEHNPNEAGQATLFETVVRVRDESRYLDRYPTWDEAMAGHERIVGRIRTTMQQDQLGAAAAWDVLAQRDGLTF